MPVCLNALFWVSSSPLGARYVIVSAAAGSRKTFLVAGEIINEPSVVP